MHEPHGVGRGTGQGGRLVEHIKGQRNERGQAMVEFALTITVTLMLVFGMIDFSRAIYTASVIQWAAQQGARTAMVDRTFASVRPAVVNRLAGLDPDEVDVNVTSNGNVVQVTVSYEFDFIVPMISRITGDSITLTASASMMVQ